MITKEEFVLLYEKDLLGQCTPEEKELLESFHDEILMPDDKWEPHLGDKNKLYNKLKANLKQSLHHNNFPKPAKSYGWLKVAASILIVSSIAIFLFRSQQPARKNQTYSAKSNHSAIYPGGNKAYLIMANGSVITLNNIKNGKLTTQSGVQINKVKDGVLEYNNASSADKDSASRELAFNTINTPRGGQYQVVLSDGTRVWLNSASSLKYPTVFYGHERRVELSGEAYFEVAKNAAKPFKVSVNGINVQVLGTHFNIMGYNDEKEVKTTLLEGSVKLTNKNCTALLKPGEQGVLNHQQTAFNIENVDVDDVVAWKNGFFAFNNEDIQTIMKEISRWYDVDVEFPEKFKRRNFGGTVSRFKDVSQVLNALELTGSIHFKVEERRIIVMP
jgi:transmembrane sensor